MSVNTIYGLDLDEEFLSHLAKPDSWTVIQGEQVTDEIIQDPAIKEIFNWQRQYIREHKQGPAPAPVLEDEFELQLEEPMTAIGDLLDRMRDRYTKNEQREQLIQLMQLQKDDPAAVPDALIQGGRKLKHITKKRGEVYGTGDIDRLIRNYHKKVLQGPGASYGWGELDSYFLGMRGLNAVLGTPKSMKSWVLVNMLLNNVKEGTCTWLFSLELPAEETEWRLKCLLADIPYWKYIHNRFTDEDLSLIYEASEILDSGGLYRIAKPPAGKRSMDDMVYQARDAGAQVILIDQLQYVEVESGNAMNIGSFNSTGMYWNVLNKARDYSDDGPILYAHQFHRGNYDAMPKMDDAKGSASIEETATVAFGLWANKDMRHRGELELGVLCARNHMETSWLMQVDMRHGCSFDILKRLDEEE